MSKDTKPAHLLEIAAMKSIAKALDALPEDARRRVLEWASRAYVPIHTGGSK